MRSRLLLPLIALAVLVTASGCTTGRDVDGASTPGTDTTAVVSGEVDWGSCTNAIARATNLECGRLAVPIDHDRPDGDSLDLMLARQRATGPAEERIGSLLLNPGGPGGSGIEFLAAATAVFPVELTQRFDLVSFDPRGVGESSPVRCLSDEEKEEQLEGSLVPADDEEVAEALEEQRTVREACSLNAPDLIRHMSTADVATDLDLIRGALGDDELTYVGFSYGTAIGAVYATMFPKRTRALVLDGSIDPVGDVHDTMLAQARGFETTLENFISKCDAASDCALAPDSRAGIDKVRERLTRRPVDVETSSGPRRMGVDQFDVALATGLYDTDTWGLLADAVANISEGGAETLFVLLDRQTGRNEDGSFDNSSDAQAMVNCADQEDRPDATEAVEIAHDIVSQVPTFGAAIGWGALNCIDWPEASNPRPEISADGAGPILVIGTKGDPATPYEWSVAMADALTSATLLTYEGDGHTAFLRGGSCIDDAVTRFLIDLEEPSPGTNCPARGGTTSFEGLATQIVTQMVEGGIPREAAQCIVDSAIDEVGETRFTSMILRNDTEELTQLIMAKTLSCVAIKGSN